MATTSVDDRQDYQHNKQQGEEALSNLEYLFEDYDPTYVFQWELSIQMWACSATLLTNINEVGNK
eukprot:9240699-Ditylum_brightwellii.AAC.1